MLFVQTVNFYRTIRSVKNDVAIIKASHCEQSGMYFLEVDWVKLEVRKETEGERQVCAFGSVKPLR